MIKLLPFFLQKKVTTALNFIWTTFLMGRLHKSNMNTTRDLYNFFERIKIHILLYTFRMYFLICWADIILSITR